VQHLCSRCGAAVDDTSPFCPACEAPQIRFVPHEPAQEPARLHPGTVPQPPVVVAQPEGGLYRPAAASDQARFLRASIYAGAIGSLLCTLPIGFVIGVPLAGILAVRFYRKGGLAPNVPPKQGFRLGALSGLVAFGMLVLVRTVSIAAFGGGGEFRNRMVEMVRQYQAANPDPQAQQVFQFFLTQQGMVVMILSGLLFTCVLFIVLAGLAGLVSASVSGRRPPR
jgi:hypothetical protein